MNSNNIKNAPSRARTYDPGVISTMLYRLSYESSQRNRGKSKDMTINSTETEASWSDKKRNRASGYKTKNAPSRARTYDPGVISTMLYRLSYESSQRKGGKRVQESNKLSRKGDKKVRTRGIEPLTG